MSKFITSRDRINRATGENSSVDWNNFPADIAEQLLNRIGSGKTEEDIPVTTSTACQERIVNFLGFDMTFTQALQLSSLILQFITLLVFVYIAVRTTRR